MQPVLIGQRVVKFWMGETFEFERVGRGEWKLVTGDISMVPAILIEELGD